MVSTPPSISSSRTARASLTQRHPFNHQGQVKIATAGFLSKIRSGSLIAAVCPSAYIYLQ